MLWTSAANVLCWSQWGPPVMILRVLPSLSPLPPPNPSYWVFGDIYWFNQTQQTHQINNKTHSKIRQNKQLEIILPKAQISLQLSCLSQSSEIPESPLKMPQHHTSAPQPWGGVLAQKGSPENPVWPKVRGLTAATLLWGGTPPPMPKLSRVANSVLAREENYSLQLRKNSSENLHCPQSSHAPSRTTTHWSLSNRSRF